MAKHTQDDLPDFEGYEDFLNKAKEKYGDLSKKEADVVASKKILELRQVLTARHADVFGDMGLQDMSHAVGLTLTDLVLVTLVGDDDEAKKAFIDRYKCWRNSRDSGTDQLMKNASKEEIRNLTGFNHQQGDLSGE